MNKIVPLFKMNTNKKDDKLSLNILVVEDNPADVYLINDYLKSSGINIYIKALYKISRCHGIIKPS